MSSTLTTTPEDVLKFKGPTSGFLCPLSANVYGIDFLSFTIKDVESNKVIFEVAKDPNAPPPQFPPGFDYDQLRSISYKFPRSFVDLPAVGTKLVFKVGSRPVSNFRMIERHYYKQTLIKSYDFNFVFCAPDTVNSWETEYDMPDLDPELRSAILAGGTQENQSDTFYFVDNVLIMHNKAKYVYVDDKDASTGVTAAGRSTSSRENPEEKSS